MMNPVLSRITIYPIKSLDGHSLQKAIISDGGCLLHDREYAISDAEGNLLIGKSNSLVHSLRSAIHFETSTVSFRPNKDISWQHFHLEKEKVKIQSFLSDYFGTETLFLQNKKGRFMDIPDISGVTVISSASLHEIATWFNNLEVEETRMRFRATIEIEDVPAFWEDHLFSEEGKAIEFKIGEVTLLGISPRARCVVPTRNPGTGEVTHGFPRSFSKHRASTLPSWSTLEKYGHHYYLTVNCYIPATEVGKAIEVGQELKIIGEKYLS